MNRRSFFASILGALAAPWAAKATPAVPARWYIESLALRGGPYMLYINGKLEGAYDTVGDAYAQAVRTGGSGRSRENCEIRLAPNPSLADQKR